MTRLTILAALVAALAACGDQCKAGSMRCSGNTAQMCNSDQDWEDYQNCSAIGERCSTSEYACSGYSGLACCY